MSMHTQQAVSGFIATDPQLTRGDAGIARFYARFGQEHYRREDDGAFTQLEPTFHNLVLYRKTAERAMEQLARGDRFVAEGYVHEYTYDHNGQAIHGEEFVAKKIGHDMARNHYTVDRTHTHQTPQEAVAPATPRGHDPAIPLRPAPTAATAGLGL